MKLSKEELKNKIVDEVSDEDTQIALLEDIEDSFVEGNEDLKIKYEDLKAKYEDLKIKYEDLKAKYKERFLKGDDVEDEEAKEDDEELKEEEVIDIKEI